MTTMRTDELAGWERLTTSPPAGFAKRWWRYAPLPLAAAYLLALAVQFGHVVASTYLSADSASGPVISQLFGQAPAGAHVVLGLFGWYSTLIYEVATKWVPFHREFWEACPYAMALVSAGLTSAAVWRVAGRSAACLTGVLLICVSPPALNLLMSPNVHGPAWFCIAVLGWWLVGISVGTFDGRPRLAILLVLVIGVVVGAESASDPLTTLGGLVPFVLGSVVGCFPAVRRGNYRRAGLALATLLAIAAGWLATYVAMSALNVTSSGANVTGLATQDQIGTNFKLWWQSIAVLGNGDFFGLTVTPTSALAVVCAGLSITAVVLIPRLCWHELRDVARVTPAAWATPRRALLIFWSCAAVLLSVSFILGSTPVDIQSDRYLVGLIYAGAVVIPVVASGRLLTESLAVAGTVLVALGGTISMARGNVFALATGLPSDAVISQVEQVAVNHNLRIGYAGYWDASPVTWGSHDRIEVFPVMSCAGGNICEFFLHVISTWYAPRPNIRTFVIVDPTLPFLQAEPTGFGRPVATYHIDQLTMYVYPYDVASKIKPAP